jgi:hypothetical protein
VAVARAGFVPMTTCFPPSQSYSYSYSYSYAGKARTKKVMVTPS